VNNCPTSQGCTPRRKFGLLVLHMNPEGCWFPTRLGILHIGSSPRDGSCWPVWLDDRLVCHGCGSPDEAADRANRRDFSESSAVELLRGVPVPYELNRWWRSPPERSSPTLDLPEQETGCKQRPWKPNTGNL
jgi:hypothetical protein